MLDNKDSTICQGTLSQEGCFALFMATNLNYWVYPMKSLVFKTLFIF